MRIMPKIIHDPLNPSEGIELPTVPPDEWIATVEKLVGQSLNKAEKAYATALAEHYNWTATVVADHLRLNRAAPDLLEALGDAKDFIHTVSQPSEPEDSPRYRYTMQVWNNVIAAIAKATT